MNIEMRDDIRDQISYMSLCDLKGGKRRIHFVQNHTPSVVMNAACAYYGFHKDTIVRRGRRKQIAECRHVTAYLLKRYTNMSLKEIGLLMGGRDHTTVINSLRRIKGLMETEEDLVERVKAIQSMI